MKDEARLSNCNLIFKFIFDSCLNKVLVIKHSLFLILISISNLILLLNPIAALKYPTQEEVQIPPPIAQMSWESALDRLSCLSPHLSPASAPGLGSQKSRQFAHGRLSCLLLILFSALLVFTEVPFEKAQPVSAVWRKTRKGCLSICLFVWVFPLAGSLKGGTVHGDGEEAVKVWSSKVKQRDKIWERKHDQRA